MRSLCFYFQVHQPYRLRTYRFFDIGKRHFYFDEYANRTTMQRVSELCYLPMNQLIMRKIEKLGGKLKLALSFSGTVIEQMQQYAPAALDSFRKLVATGNVEVLAETYSHSIASMVNKDAFKMQVAEHKKLMKDVFGVRTRTFHNTELIYSNEIGKDVSEMGFDLILTEGAKHVLGWKSPNYLYVNALNPKMKVMLRNWKLSDEIALNFRNGNFTVDSFVDMLNAIPKEEEVVNVFVDYETFGANVSASTGIFDFMEYLPEAVLERTDFQFVEPHQIADKLQPMGVFDAPIPLSCRDEERDMSTWMGNDLQDDAIETLYSNFKKVKTSKDEELMRDWNALQASENFAGMCTKHSGGTPYDFYINYMNILTDFKNRI
mgnify:CR=1 FL=1